MTPTRAGTMGRPRVWYPEVTSTMDVARSLAARGAPHGTVVEAGYQSAGRGRGDRRWDAVPASALLTSWIMRPESGAHAAALSPLVALALIRAVEGIVPGASVAYRWPNDVLMDGRKLAGILLACTTRGVESVVIAGVGVNVSEAPEGGACLREWCVTATTDRLRDELATELDTVWAAWSASGHLAIDDRAALEARMAWRSEVVELCESSGSLAGRIAGLEPDGALRLRLACDGSVRTVHAGEIVRGPRPTGPKGPDGCRILP